MHTWLVLLLVSGLAPAPPTINSLNPNSLTVGAADLTLTVIGTEFTRRAEVRWDGTPLETTFVNDTRLTAVVPADHFDSGGAHQVTVFVPGGNGGTSNALTFTVIHPTPTITGLTPARKEILTGAFTLTVAGTNFFTSGSTVQWNGAARTTTYVSPTRLEAAITANDLATNGTANVTVQTRAGASVRTSAPATFTVTLPTSTALTVSLNPKPVLGLTSFFIGGADNPERVLAGNAVALQAVRSSGSVTPTHWRVSANSLFRGATWQAYTTPARYTFSTASIGERTLYFQYRHIFSSDTTLSNVMSDNVVVRGPWTTATIARQLHMGRMTTGYARLECAAGQVMTGVRVVEGDWIEGIGLICAGVNQAMTGTTQNPVVRSCSGGTVPGNWSLGAHLIGFLRNAGFNCVTNVFGAGASFDPLYAVPTAGVGAAGSTITLWRGCRAGIDFVESYRTAPVALDVYFDVVLMKRGLAGIGFVCAKPD